MEELIKHYVDLLIIQYRTKMKAMATIEAFVKVVFADDSNEIFLNKIQNAYDLDTASLAQLNVLAKYIGYDDYLDIINTNYFKLSDTEGEDVTPGLSDTEGQYVGYPLLNYSGYTYTKVSLSGLTNVDFFRKVLKFLAEMKNEILSAGNIDRILYKHFGEDISIEEGVKSITYIYSKAILELFNGNVSTIETFIKKYFPKPMGCSLSVRQEYYYLQLDPINGAELDENYIFTNNQADIDPQINTVKYFKTKEPIDARNRSKDIEFRMKFKVSSVRSGFFCADPSQANWNSFLSGYIFTSRQLGISINANAYGNVYVDLDTWYWVRMTHVANSNTWKVEYSTDGINYSLVYDFGYSLSIPPMYMWLGAGASTGSTYGLSGSVDFKETDIIIDGKSVLWTTKKNII